ncbi:MAG: penicillin-binding protein activator LpoB [Deltaproteobacteria bacterium]|nr:penicillin-binding protein activator LpoB [Deltaproteobacteria bacterium]
MKSKFAALLALLIPTLVILGCAQKMKVSRIEVDTITDLSGRWNDTDSRLVSEEMIKDCLNRPWLRNHVTENNKKPVVIVGAIRNKSLEHIPTDTFIGDIEQAFVNSGQVEVVANVFERLDLRGEKDDQSEFSSLETQKRMREELGADYMMTGLINSIEDKEGGEKIVFYQVDLTLINVETNAKVWIGQKKIKKYIARGRYEP